MPESATVEDIEQLHLDSWKLGLKAVAIYRDNCKVAQPLSMAKKAGSEEKTEEEAPATQVVANPVLTGGVAIRQPLPKVRNSKTFSFTVADCHGYLIVGEYEDGRPGELFIDVAKMGSTLSGLMDSFARSVSYGLQHGVSLKVYVKGMTSISFAPSGITDDSDIRTATSLVDYIFRRLALNYLSFDDRLELGLASIDDMPVEQTSLVDIPAVTATPQTQVLPIEMPKQQTPAPVAPQSTTPKPSATHAASSAPMCYNCGNQTQKAGSCYVCTTCGSTTGCS
jgi:ribonucleoside-diphosphate reductase alpha chain